jgi:hypothetical protein
LGDFFTNTSGANPTTAIFNASALKIFYCMSSLGRFERKAIFLLLKNALAYYVPTTLAL